MISFFSSWVKGLGLAIIIVSILEMLLPNNKTKKYIRMVMGLYILFTMISPFVNNKDLFDVSKINFDDYIENSQTVATSSQNGMEDRVKDLYIQELKKDVTRKLKEKGYEVTNCVIDVDIAENNENSKINKMKINVKKIPQEQQASNNTKNETLENTIVVRDSKNKTYKYKYKRR